MLHELSKEFEEFKPLIEIKEDPRSAAIEYTQQKIQNTYFELEKQQIDQYQNLFEDIIDKERVIIGEVNLDELNEEQKRIEEARLKQSLDDAEEFEKQRIELLKAKQESKAYIFHKQRVLANLYAFKELDYLFRVNQRRAFINLLFKKAESDLIASLRKRQGEVITEVTDVATEEVAIKKKIETENKERLYQVIWRKSPQVVELRVELCRNLKDKVPSGRYAILVSILDRVGGNAMSFHSKTRSKRYRRITRPKQHTSLYNQNELRFEESLIIPVPSREDIRPSNIYLFELFLLRSKDYPYDQVLGWGVFPLINEDLLLNSGKFKIPLLFGQLDSNIYKYSVIEKLYRDDLNSWLCNLYFEVTNLFEDLSHYKIYVTLKFDDLVRVNNFDEEEEQMKQLNLEMANNDSDNEDDRDQLDDVNNAILEINKEDNYNSLGVKLDNRNKIYQGIQSIDDYYLYTYAIKQPEISFYSGLKKKLFYILPEVLEDIGLRNFMSIEFIVGFAIFLVCLVVRIYMHYFGSYIFLLVYGVTPNTFKLYLFTVVMDYPMVSASSQIFITIVGNIFTTFIFGLLIAIVWTIKVFCVQTPKIFYKIVTSFGVAVVFDFFLLLMVDLAIQNEYGEAFIIYEYFERTESNGVMGIVITSFTYISIFILNLFVFYVYMIYVSFDGRLIDIYSRVTGPPDHFFVPHDNEISLKYLKNLLYKMKRDNKSNYTNPKVTSLTFNLMADEEDLESKIERYTYIAIYIKSEDEKYHLHRHFIRAPSGSLHELEEYLLYNYEDFPILTRWPNQAKLIATEEFDEEIFKSKLDYESENSIVNQVSEGNSFVMFKSDGNQIQKMKQESNLLENASP